MLEKLSVLLTVIPIWQKKILPCSKYVVKTRKKSYKKKSCSSRNISDNLRISNEWWWKCNMENTNNAHCHICLFFLYWVFIMIGYFIRDINGMIAFVRRLNTVFTYLYYISPPRTPGSIFHHICDDFWPVFFDCRRPSLHSLRFHEFSLQSCSYQRNHVSKSRKYMMSSMHSKCDLPLCIYSVDSTHNLTRK